MGLVVAFGGEQEDTEFGAVHAPGGRWVVDLEDLGQDRQRRDALLGNSW